MPRSPALSAPPPVPAFSITVPLRFVGAALFALLLLALVALATWSATDPSLSNAVRTPPQNLLGAPGAVFADILFQWYGLAALAVLIAPFWWSWSLIRNRALTRPVLRVLAWALACLLTAGVMAFLPDPESWPLTTGLGGMVGLGFAALAASVAGEPATGSGAALFAVLLTAPALMAWTFALKGAVPAIDVTPRKKDDGEERDPNPVLAALAGAGTVLLGALTHALLRLGVLIRAWWRSRAERRAADAEEESRATERQIEPDMRESRAAQDADVRIEPRLADFGPSDRLYDADPDLSGGSDDRHEPEPEDEDGSPLRDDMVDLPEPGRAVTSRTAPARPAPARPAPASQETAAQRPMSGVAKGPAKIQPGRRAMAEAQTSLLGAERFELPALAMLEEPQPSRNTAEFSPEALEQNARLLEGVLDDFGVKGDIINVRPGPVVTLYELEPAPGIKSSRVIGLADDIARSMSAISARVAVVPGRNAIGIELPNQTRETVYLRELLGSADFEKVKAKLPLCLGKTIGGEPVIADLARMPHLLIAGTTGSGKSVAVNTFILSLLYRFTPEQCRLIMIDPKMLELSVYDGIPHLLTPVVTDPSKAVTALKWAVREMEDRYRKMSKIGVRNIDGFNARVAEASKMGETITRTVQTGFDKETGEPIFESESFELEPLPYIVVIVDEMADLMMVAGKDIEGAIQRLAQMARAAGIHLIMATQRPSVDVITGTIKANFPTRISFQVTSKIDSRTILGEQGAEQLLGMGDMLYMAGGGRIKRLHGPFVADGEVEEIVAHLKTQGTPEYLESVTEEDDLEGGDGGVFGAEPGNSGDELYDKAVNIVLNDKKASTSYIQRRLSIGYNRAATLIERMEKEGVISPANHAGKREVLVGDNADGY